MEAGAGQQRIQGLLEEPVHLLASLGAWHHEEISDQTFVLIKEIETVPASLSVRNEGLPIEAVFAEAGRNHSCRRGKIPLERLSPGLGFRLQHRRKLIGFELPNVNNLICQGWTLSLRLCVG